MRVDSRDNKRKLAGRRGGAPQVSFLIRAYNEQRFISSKLEDLTSRLRKFDVRCEIILGIQGDDSSYKIAKLFSDRLKNIRVYKMPKPDLIGTTNFLIGKARGEIIIFDDADNLFVGDLNEVVRIFDDKKVGGIINEDDSTAELYNSGQKVFDRAYFDVKLRHHSKAMGKEKKYICVTDPIFSTNIVRRSALSARPYTKTFGTDTEVTKILIDKGYFVVYSAPLLYYIRNSPLQDNLTVKKIFARRTRTEQFRAQAKQRLDSNRFEVGSRMGEFVEAILLTYSRVNLSEFFAFTQYIIIIAATIYGRIMKIFVDKGRFIQIR